MFFLTWLIYNALIVKVKFVSSLLNPSFNPSPQLSQGQILDDASKTKRTRCGVCEVVLRVQDVVMLE